MHTKRQAYALNPQWLAAAELSWPAYLAGGGRVVQGVHAALRPLPQRRITGGRQRVLSLHLRQLQRRRQGDRHANGHQTPSWLGRDAAAPLLGNCAAGAIPQYAIAGCCGPTHPCRVDRDGLPLGVCDGEPRKREAVRGRQATVEGDGALRPAAAAKQTDECAGGGGGQDY